MANTSSWKKLKFLTTIHQERLNNYFISADRTCSPRQLSVFLGIEWSQSMLLISLLEAEGLIESYLMIYHECEESPVGVIPYGVGFPKLPWQCPECEKEEISYDVMSFDILAKAKSPISFL